MKSKIKKRNVVLAVIAIAVVGVVAVALGGSSGVEVEYESTDLGEVRDIIEEEAQAASHSTRNVTVLVSGTVLKWNKDVGDTVAEGDSLAVVDTEDIDKQIAIADEELSALKYAFEDALEPNDRELIRQYEAGYNAAVIARDSAKSTYEKNTRLYEEGAVSSQAYEDSKDALSLAQEDVNSKYQALLQARKGLSEALKNKFGSEIKAKERAIEVLRLQRDRHEIKSTQSGVILNRYIEAGDYISIGQTTFEIADTGQIYFKSDILDSDIALISKGTPVVVYIDDNDTLTGSVVKVYPKAETQISDLGIEQKRVTVEIDADLMDRTILIGQELDIDFVVESRENALRIREDLTYQKDEAYHVFVEKDGKAVETKIDVGLVGDTYIEVLGGLAEGDRIIVPSDEIEPDSKVKLKE